MNTLKLYPPRSRCVLIVGLLFALMPPLFAQQPETLATDAVIIKYSHASNAQFANLGTDMLAIYRADFCRSLYLRPGKENSTQYHDIEVALNADRERARVMKEKLNGGKLISAYYEFTGEGKHLHYILFRYTSGSIYLISIGGSAETKSFVEKLLNRLQTAE